MQVGEDASRRGCKWESVQVGESAREGENRGRFKGCVDSNEMRKSGL